MKTIDEKIKKYEAKIAKLKLEKEQQESPEKFAMSFFEQDLICKSDEKYPNSIFYFKGDKLLLEIEKSGDSLTAWVSYSEIWNPVSEKFSLDYAQTQSLLKTTIEQHFKLKGIATISFLQNSVKSIEQHFKLKGIATPKHGSFLFLRIEQHFKLRGIATSSPTNQ
jgi:hypothetical protein